MEYKKLKKFFFHIKVIASNLRHTFNNQIRFYLQKIANRRKTLKKLKKYIEKKVLIIKLTSTNSLIIEIII